MTLLTLSIELTDAQATGIAQARTAYNSSLPEESTPLTDTEYLQYVLIGAADSYAAQYSGAEPVPPSPVEPTPRKIDARRLRLALLELNLLVTVESAITSQGKAAQLEWEFASTIIENHPLVVTLVSALGLDIDQIFDLAESYS